MKGIDPMTAMAALLVGTRGKRRRERPTPQYTNVFIEDMSGKVYYIDGKGTRRKATAEEIEEYRRERNADSTL